VRHWKREEEEVVVVVEEETANGLGAKLCP